MFESFAPPAARRAAPPAARRGAPAGAASGVLFADEFPDPTDGVTILDDPVEDGGEPDRAPEPPPPDLDAIRSEAFAEGRRDALRDAAVLRDAAARALLAALTERLSASAAEARGVAEQTADALARLLLGALAAVLPSACARHGPAEVAAIAAAVLPALGPAPEIGVRVSPHAADALDDVLGRLDPDLRRRVRVVHTDALAEGDIRIGWQDGQATRDTAALLREVADILGPLGLLEPDVVEA